MMIIVFTLIILSFTSLVFLLLIRRRGRSSNRLQPPPGSLGVPIIGQSFSLLRAMKSNTAESWVQDRAKKYGPVSKLSLFGKPTVFIHGQSANRFIFNSDGTTLSNHQTESIKRLMGDRNIQELSGEDHKRIRTVLVSFLKPESLKQYVSKIDEEVRKHIQTYWQGKQSVKVLPLMKTLTFNISCSLLFGVESMAQREELLKLFNQLVQGVWSIPINLPFTRYNRSLSASSKIQKILKQLIRQKRVDLRYNGTSTHQDLITSLLRINEQENKEVISEDEIVDNTILLMIAGHDTSSVLLTFLVRVLATDPTIYRAVYREQEEIAKNKTSGEFLTWEDLTKMKYTWRVAMETLRMYPPVFGGFRTALKEIEYDGYIIPKGWQVFWSTSMTHMDGNIFEEPSKFDPARFENQTSISPYCFIPFGAGYRICPGYEFAKVETLIAVHYLVTRFKWKLCCNDNFISRDPWPTPTQGLPIQLEPK